MKSVHWCHRNIGVLFFSAFIVCCCLDVWILDITVKSLLRQYCKASLLLGRLGPLTPARQLCRTSLSFSKSRGRHMGTLSMRPEWLLTCLFILRITPHCLGNRNRTHTDVLYSSKVQPVTKGVRRNNLNDHLRHKHERFQELQNLAFWSILLGNIKQWCKLEEERVN